MDNQFDTCLGFVLGAEGGFSNDPRDPGGATYRGITIGSLRDWLGDPDATVEQLQALQPDDVAGFYRSRYWDSVCCGSMPAGLDLMVFDHAVNAGNHGSAVLLQRVLGVDDDGQVGPLTLGAIAGRDVVTLLGQLRAAQEASYRRTRNFRAFGRGWLRRVGERHARAVAMAHASV